MASCCARCALEAARSAAAFWRMLVNLGGVDAGDTGPSTGPATTAPSLAANAVAGASCLPPSMSAATGVRSPLSASVGVGVLKRSVEVADIGDAAASSPRVSLVDTTGMTMSIARCALALS